MSFEKSQWVRITRGPHRGKTGVIDLISAFPVGTLYRVTNPHDKLCHGRFPAECLEPIEKPVYASQIAPEVAQRALDLLMGVSK